MGGCGSAQVSTAAQITVEEKRQQAREPEQKASASQPSSSSQPPAATIPFAKPPVTPAAKRGDVWPKEATDKWLQATYVLLLRRLVAKHPFLEAGCSAQPHPLQNWLERCRESYLSRKYRRASEHLLSIKQGLLAESKPVAETFRRFDADNSGHLDDEEFANLCAYLGWDEEKKEQMDLDKDGRVTVQDMQEFVGYMGGVQNFFEKRRLRITRSRNDVCDYSGISVGARVRAYFYVQGQRSGTWREAIVREVGLAQRYGGMVAPATLGVALEFFFSPNDRHHNWRARQVVPMSWIIGVVEDANVAASLRDVGIVDDEHTFWAALLPDSEMHAMGELQTNQRAALALVRRQASEAHERAVNDVRKRFKGLGYGERELLAVLGWVQDLAPIIVPVDMDAVGCSFESDEYYRNQFEKNEESSARRSWEHEMFGGLYDAAKPFERVKYGVLDMSNDFRGVKAASKGLDSYLVLKDVRLRSTFTSRDGPNGSGKKLGVLEKYMHILEEYSNEELKSLVNVAAAAIAPARVGGLPTEGQGELRLLRGVTQDPTREWVTLGFPGLAEASGRYFFEVVLQEGCSAPQVGFLSTLFTESPTVASAQGVGDDEYGWAVDGSHSARWHSGCTKAWEMKWPSNGSILSAPVVVGFAVDLDRRNVLAATNGRWGDEAVFTEKDIPPGLKLYPAVSMKGRAEFVFGPDFRCGPPRGKGYFAQWPRTMGGFVRADCPEIGSSENVKVWQEVQVHGELSLKKNVQRLVASSKYREKPKTKRSYSLNVTGAAHCSGVYNRDGARADMPLYKNSAGGVIYWDPHALVWRMNDTEDFRTSVMSAAPVEGSTDVPRDGWQAPDEWFGVMESAAFRQVLEKNYTATEDIVRIVANLTKDGTGSGMIYKVLDKRSLENEWTLLPEPSFTAAETWEMAIREIQSRFLAEAGFPESHVIETEHPYDAVRSSWKKTVTPKNAKGLSVYFAKSSATRDSRTKFTVSAGGLQREEAGKGARVELVPRDGGKLLATLESATPEVWVVRLDRRKQAVFPSEEDWKPAVGDIVEAKYKESTWYKATVTDVFEKVDWFEGSKAPMVYTIEWLDGDLTDKEKMREQLRKPRTPAHAGCDLESLGRYGFVAPDGAPTFASCSETPKTASVYYQAGVGVEIQKFRIDRSQPLTPVVVEAFQAPGPAQEKGVRPGWFLDIVSSVKASRRKYAELLAGLGGVEVGDSDRQVEKLLDAAFFDLDGLLERLNDGLRGMAGVTLVFANSATAQKLKLQPVVHATYPPGTRVGGEVKLFSAANKKVSPEAFLKSGAAQLGGVRSEWQLDLAKTRELNPKHAEALQNDVVLGNPNTLLALEDITLAFRLPQVKKAQKFLGSGPASPEKWASFEIQHGSADFEFATDGDGAGEPEKRWGVWALVLDRATKQPSQQVVDALADRWVAATTKARGCSSVPRVERDGWDEGRLRALCARHGWEFEWMTEDGERRRRAHERQGFLQASGQLSGGAEAAKAAEAALMLQQERAPPELAESPYNFVDADRFTLMTFNVEEYYHGGSKGGGIPQTVFKNLRGINEILRSELPDVVCIQEHSLGKKGSFSEQEIMDALIEGTDYEWVSYPTGEQQAWFSALANLVMWSPKRFAKVKSWRVELAKANDLIPGTASGKFTPRAATCVELVRTGSGKRVVVCSTHLMGGRFEDKSFVNEAIYGKCVRAEQVEKIANSVRTSCGKGVANVISGDFNVMNKGYLKDSPFRHGAMNYFEMALISDAIQMARPSGSVGPPSELSAALPLEDLSFDGFYVPFQTKVHQVLDRKLGYVSAYGGHDAQMSMKTTTYSGCIDWVYLKNLLSMKNERVLDVLSKGYSDHNPVCVTLALK